MRIDGLNGGGCGHAEGRPFRPLPQDDEDVSFGGGDGESGVFWGAGDDAAGFSCAAGGGRAG